MKYDNVFIDLDGTVLDGKQRHYRCYCSIIKDYNGIPLDIEMYWKLKRGRISALDLLKLSQCNMTSTDFIKIWIEKIERKEFLQFDILKEGASEKIIQFREAAERINLVTMRKNKENLFWQLKNLGIFRLFDEIIVANETKEAALSRFRKSYSVIIGDTEADIYAAEKLDFIFLGIENGLRYPKIFKGKKSYPEFADINL